MAPRVRGHLRHRRDGLTAPLAADPRVQLPGRAGSSGPDSAAARSVSSRRRRRLDQDLRRLLPRRRPPGDRDLHGRGDRHDGPRGDHRRHPGRPRDPASARGWARYRRRRARSSMARPRPGQLARMKKRASSSAPPPRRGDGDLRRLRPGRATRRDDAESREMLRAPWRRRHDRTGRRRRLRARHERPRSAHGDYGMAPRPRSARDPRSLRVLGREYCSARSKQAAPRRPGRHRRRPPRDAAALGRVRLVMKRARRPGAPTAAFVRQMESGTPVSSASRSCRCSLPSIGAGAKSVFTLEVI